MRQRNGTRSPHRQLQPTDIPIRGSGATPLRVLSDHHRDIPPRSEPPPAESSNGTASWCTRRVLLLNATYAPLTALPARRAVVLLVCAKADPVHQDSTSPVVHSTGTAVALPSVIRLRTYVHVPYRARVPLTRTALMQRDQYRCGYCGAKADTIDHVQPRSRGGAHSWENCVASCARCNHRKADRLLSELGWALQAPLVSPKGPHWRLMASTSLDPVWLPYLEGAA